MTQSATNDDAKLRAAVDRDGLLDLFVGASLLLTLGLSFLSWSFTGNPGMFAGIVPLLPAFFFEPARRKYTYSRLGCPDYKPTKEIRFATIVLAALAVLGAVAFLVTTLVDARALRPLFEHAPAWAALFGAGLMVVLRWWYRSLRFLGYIGVAAVAVLVGYLFGSGMPVRLAVLAGAVGLAMTVVGAVRFGRFLHSFPRIRDAAQPGSARQP